jgi:putative cardiolipin synthase
MRTWPFTRRLIRGITHRSDRTCAREELNISLLPRPRPRHSARSISHPAIPLTSASTAAPFPAGQARRSRAGPAGQALLAGCLLGLAGCAAIPTGGLPASHALEHPQSTTLGRALAGLAAGHPGESGFHLLEFGPEALAARLCLIDAAERTIDVQTYILDDDQTGDLLTLHLLQAADRGVRVRLLLDDFNLRHAAKLSTLSTVPNFAVRVYNPVHYHPRWALWLEYAFDFKRLNRRMHVKQLTVDGTAVILGGRNIGDDYFDLENKHGFRDFDLLAAGDITRQASAIFDAYWNSPWAVPVAKLATPLPDPNAVALARAQIGQRALGVESFARQYEATRDGYLADLERGDSLVWAPGEIRADPAAQVVAPLGAISPLTHVLEEEWRGTHREALIEAAYFVPGPDGMGWYRALRARGVTVTVLTNTAATTDVPVVYDAYERYRRRLLEAGVGLYEYKRDGAGLPAEASWFRPRQSYAILHSKVLVFDRKRVWIGSYNLDPRSAFLNLEIGAIIDSPQLAEETARDIRRDCAPNQSWRVSLEPPPSGSATSSAPTRLVWTGEAHGRPALRHFEPVGFFQRLRSFFLFLIPGIEKQL